MAHSSLQFNNLYKTISEYNKNGWRESIPERLRCVLCQQMLNHAVQTSCGCRYCKNCLISHLSDGEKCCVGNSEECKEETIKPNISLSVDNAINKEISRFDVNCFNEGCTEKCALGIMWEHLNVCIYRKKTCTKCSKEYQKVKEKDHLLSECDYRVIVCVHCKKEVNFLELESLHYSISNVELCSKYSADCPYNCGMKNVNLFIHRELCSNLPGKCCFNVFGCNWEGAKPELASHLITCGSKHVGEVYKKLKDLEEENVNLRSIVYELKEENKNIKEEFESLRAVVLTRMDDFDRMSSRASSHSSRSADTGSLYRNGTFIWKIDKFSQLKRDAENRGITTKTSEPFYTSEFGYKMCLKIYPAGDGVGRGTHLSVFFALMKGDFDELLSWPFKNKVMLVIMDTHEKAIYSETFKPDLKSVCYQKPTDTYNIASGSPKFVSFIDLFSKCLKNDQLYLKISIVP